MAQNFRRYTSNDVGVSAATLFTANSYDTVVGISVANVTASPVTASVYINDGTNDIYLVKDAPIPAGSALQVLDGGAKVVVQSGDILKVVSSAASSLDIWISTVDDISSQDIHMAFIGRKPTNAPLTSDDIPNGIISAADLASGISGLITWQSVQTTGFTAVSGRGYPCNTTSAAFTVTLPASPSVGDTIQILDYAGTFATNNITLGRNSNKIDGGSSNKLLTTNREAVTITYIDSTQGWLSTSGSNEGSVSLEGIAYTADFLVIAGGGGSAWGGGGAGGYRNSYSTETSGGGGSSEASLTFTGGTVYTITVGAGGSTSGVVTTGQGATGSDSSISGTGISTITSTGGGGGGSDTIAGKNGGSGGGGANGSALGTGTANQGYNGASGGGSGSGGGGASATGTASTAGSQPSVGGNGGAGLSSSITGSSVGRAGGGGGGGRHDTGGAGGTGGTATNGGGAGGTSAQNGNAGTVNTGGGAGGGGLNTTAMVGASGGSGVVILSMPDANYSGTTTGSPTVATGVSGKTVLTFTGSGSYTA